MDDNNTEANDIDQAAVVEALPECSTNRGGCDHLCEMIEPKNSSNVKLVVRCTCFKGYRLDQLDGKTCHGKELCFLLEITKTLPHHKCMTTMTLELQALVGFIC